MDGSVTKNITLWKDFFNTCVVFGVLLERKVDEGLGLLVLDSILFLT